MLGFGVEDQSSPGPAVPWFRRTFVQTLPRRPLFRLSGHPKPLLGTESAPLEGIKLDAPKSAQMKPASMMTSKFGSVVEGLWLLMPRPDISCVW